MYDTVWYDNLIKPLFTPPEWVFTPVWILLYGMIFASLIMYSTTITKKNKLFGFVVFVVHLVINLLWSPVFFIVNKIDIALVLIILMIITLIVLIKNFYSVNKISGYLLVPYFLWLLFAFYLNLEFLKLN